MKLLPETDRLSQPGVLHSRCLSNERFQKQNKKYKILTSSRFIILEESKVLVREKNSTRKDPC